MNNNGRDQSSGSQSRQKAEISLYDLIQIIKRRKKTIIISTLSTLLLVLIYNFFASPVYEAASTLKKEVVNNRGSSDEFKQMFSMQTMDELDTEIEIIKTRTVLEKIIEELDLLIDVQKVVYSDGRVKEVNKPLFSYKTLSRNAVQERLPQFSNFQIDLNNPFISKEYSIKISSKNIFELYDEESEILLNSAERDSTAEFNIEGLQFTLQWPKGKPGDIAYIKIKNIESVYINI